MPLDDHFDRLVQFMISSCDLIVSMMPAVTVDALDVARRFWNGDATPIELEGARVKCWEYLEAIGAGSTLEDAHVCATRAVICTLYPKVDDEDALEVAQWFVMLVGKVRNVGREQRQILANLFRIEP